MLVYGALIPGKHTQLPSSQLCLQSAVAVPAVLGHASCKSIDRGHRLGLICASYFWSAVSYYIKAQQQQLPSAWWLVSAVYNCATVT